MIQRRGRCRGRGIAIIRSITTDGATGRRSAAPGGGVWRCPSACTDSHIFFSLPYYTSHEPSAATSCLQRYRYGMFRPLRPTRVRGGPLRAGLLRVKVVSFLANRMNARPAFISIQIASTNRRTKKIRRPPQPLPCTRARRPRSPYAPLWERRSVGPASRDSCPAPRVRLPAAAPPAALPPPLLALRVRVAGTPPNRVSAPGSECSPRSSCARSPAEIPTSDAQRQDAGQHRR